MGAWAGGNESWWDLQGRAYVGPAVLGTEHGENVNSSFVSLFCSFWPTQAPRAVELSGPKSKLQIALKAGGWTGVQRDHDQEI